MSGIVFCMRFLAAIVLPDLPTDVERSAAEELKGAVAKITGAELRVVPETDAPRERNFHVGATRRAAALSPATWRQDEVLVAPDGDDIVLAGHPERGAFYAVDVYLEDVCGVRWWTSTESFYPHLSELPSPPAAIRHAPPILFRETYFLDGYTNALFKVRSKGNFSSRTRYMFHDLERVPKSLGGDHRLFYYKGRGSAYHSFFEVLPPKLHFACHPEWYSMVAGKRTPRQLCLTNEEMTHAYIAETLRLLAEDPSVDFVSVSQNDWQGACECPDCRAVIEEEGAASGLYLRFANAVAEAVERVHPHVKVDTFAYQFTVRPPNRTRPRHNVVVRLCAFGSAVNEPYETGRLEDGFAADLAKWAQVAPGRLFVWDYVVDFWSYMLPHPNIRSLAPNVRLFARNGAVGVFEQGDALCAAGSFAALKHWYLAHLLWNPDVDAERLLADFLAGYYGRCAAPLMKEYIDVFEDCAARYAARGGRIRYGHSDVNDFVDAADARRARHIMARALAAAADDGPDFVRRVRRERISLDHAYLLNFIRWCEPGDRAAAVERWIADCREFGVEAHRETVDRGELDRYFGELRKSARRFTPVGRDFAPEAETGAAIQKAVDAANAAGGGRVVLKPCVYTSGTIYLKSNVELHLPKGAVLRGGARPDDYDDVTDPRVRKSPERSKKAFIACLFQDNVAITGEGVIDGQGVGFYDGVTPDGRHFLKPPHPRTRMIEFVGCTRVRFADVTLKDSPGWTCWLRKCENVVAERVKIHGDQRMINNDGFHIDGCRWVVVRGCDIRTGDDCIVMRAIRTRDGDSDLCRDVIVEDCSLDSTCQCIRLGCPSDGTISRGLFRNLRMRGFNGILSGHPTRYLQEGDHGNCRMEDILVEDCEIDVEAHPVSFWVDPGVTLRAFGNVTFRNIRLKGGRPVTLKGTGDTILRNVRFENVTGVVTADVPVEMRSVSDIDFRGFNVTSGPGLRSTPGENTGDSWERDP